MIAMVLASVALSCAPGPGGGVPAPMLNSTGGISGSGVGSYHCSFPWAIQVMPEYEQGGRWHVASFLSTRGPQRGMYKAGSTHQVREGAYTNGQPACGYNWRFHVYFSLRGRILVAQTASRELRRSCPR